MVYRFNWAGGQGFGLDSILLIQSDKIFRILGIFLFRFPPALQPSLIRSNFEQAGKADGEETAKKPSPPAKDELPDSILIFSHLRNI